MAMEPTIEDLLAAILDAQNRCNNLIGQLFNRLGELASNRDSVKEAQAIAIDKWKTENKELSSECKHLLAKFGSVHKNLLERMLNDLNNLNDEDSEFEVREFMDKYGQVYIQLCGLIQSVAQLSS